LTEKPVGFSTFARWRKVLTIFGRIVFLGPFFYVIIWPNLTGTSPQVALVQAVGFLASPFILLLAFVAILLAYGDILRRYGPQR
jgi:hypothetical protein